MIRYIAIVSMFGGGGWFVTKTRGGLRSNIPLNHKLAVRVACTHLQSPD